MIVILNNKYKIFKYFVKFNEINLVKNYQNNLIHKLLIS